MKRYFRDMKIKTRIIIIYIAVLILSFMLTISTISLVNSKYMEKEIGNAGVQTVNALTGNLSFIFENVTQFSDLIYFDDHVQNALNSVESVDINPVIQRNIQKSLTNMILSGDYISGVFIFDKYMNAYSSYKVGPIFAHRDMIEETKWYQQMKQANGNGFFVHRSEDVLQFPTTPDRNYISYIREIGNKETYEPIAILMVMIDAKILHSYFEEVSAAYNSQFFIVDGEGNYIIPPNENTEEYHDYIMENQNYTGYKKAEIADKTMIMVGEELQIQDWKLVGSFQIRTDIGALAPYYTTAVIIIMSVNLILVFICSLVMTRLIFAPLSKVESHMLLVEKGKFVEMPVEKGNNEITRLKHVFNHMTNAIQDLIDRIKEEEQMVAKRELDLIQAQINPHFLYNTLDAVSALALMEDHENCYRMTRALSLFYRNSLNSGFDFITIRDELQCIESYMTILNIRYENRISVEYDIEEGIEDFYILKLLLQPVIENAVHHGIKQNGGTGTLSVKIYRDEEELIFIVTDDGCGMDEKRIERVLSGKTKTGKSGFGIYSLIQRIYLYYNIENPVTIHSEVGSGTEVTIRIGVINREDVV